MWYFRSSFFAEEWSLCFCGCFCLVVCIPAMRAVMDAAVYAAVFAAARAVIARILLAEALDRFLDDGDGLVAVRLGDDEGRDEADDVLADGRDEQVTVEAAVLDLDA